MRPLRSTFCQPGLGVEVNLANLEKYRVEYDFLSPPRHVYRYRRANGEVTYYGCSKQELHDAYVADGQPIAEPGSALEVMLDDGSASFEDLYQAVQHGHTLRRSEPMDR